MPDNKDIRARIDRLLDESVVLRQVSAEIIEELKRLKEVVEQDQKRNARNKKGRSGAS
jgi:hypothetical protein